MRNEERPILHVRVDVHPDVLEEEKKIPCGCGQWLVYGTFPHSTYSIYGERVEVEKISAYRCNNCTLVVYLPEVTDELNLAIENERHRLSLA